MPNWIVTSMAGWARASNRAGRDHLAFISLCPLKRRFQGFPEPRLAPAQPQVTTGQIGRPLLWCLPAEVGVTDAGKSAGRGSEKRCFSDTFRNRYGSMGPGCYR